MRQPESTFLQPEEEDRRDDQHMQQRRHHAAEHRRRERFHHLRADARAPHDRQQTCDDGGHRHHFGAQSQQCSVNDGLAERSARQRPTHCLALPRDRLFQVNDHDDARLHRGAEQRDEPDPYRDREVVAEQPE